MNRFMKICLRYLLYISPLVGSQAAYASVEPQLAYKVSDTDIKIYVRQVNNIEQCIFPELGKEGYAQIYQHWTLEDRIVMELYSNQMLKDLIGEDNYKLWRSDPASKNYFAERHAKFNHQKANVDETRCEEFKKEYANQHKYVTQMILEERNKQNNR